MYNGLNAIEVFFSSVIICLLELYFLHSIKVVRVMLNVCTSKANRLVSIQVCTVCILFFTSDVLPFRVVIFYEKKIEDTQGVITNHKSEDRKNKGQTKRQTIVDKSLHKRFSSTNPIKSGDKNRDSGMDMVPTLYFLFKSR